MPRLPALLLACTLATSAWADAEPVTVIPGVVEPELIEVKAAEAKAARAEAV